MIAEAMRSDCAERLDTIMSFMDDNISGLSVIDIGCGNGYFIDRLIEYGANYAYGVDPQFQDGAIIYSNIDIFNDSKFDICLYLDLHYHEGIDYLGWIKDHCNILFTAASGLGNNNDRYEKDLKEVYTNVTRLGDTGYAGRMMFACWSMK